MEAMDMSETLRVLDSSLSRTNWRLKASSKRRLETGMLSFQINLTYVIICMYCFNPNILLLVLATLIHIITLLQL
ncbi:hypothetical protein Hanom_Chr11g01037711 [Helianthus anomalus]